MSTKLSIVIVSYNVCDLLRACLLSIQKATNTINTEVFVVDNASNDASVKMLTNEFPEVNLIVNIENKGFSIANNQAIKRANGEYILLLNPDTLIPPKTFLKVLNFMDETTNIGGLGVKMLNEYGNFLPESKRGFPSLSATFYKLSGLARLFPTSERFAAYYLGHLDENKSHKIDILAGAFMLIPKIVLNKTGLLDETFFMYGEDIDLSYRISQAGYENYYYPTSITHYKGQSTPRNNSKQIFHFYNSMLIFIAKHFNFHWLNPTQYLVKMGIYLIMGLALLKNWIIRHYNL